MKKWVIRAPRMLDDMGSAAFKPGAGLLLLIAIAIYMAYSKASVVGLIIYGAVLALCGDYDSFNSLMDDMVSSQGVMIFSLLITALLIMFTLIYLKRIEKRPLATAGILRGRIAARYAVGFGLGAAALLVNYVPFMLSEDLLYTGISVFVPVYLLAFMIQSASEEIFFRGFLMTGIAKRTGILAAVLISSALFSFAHIFNGGYSLLGGIYYALIGAFLALLMLRTNSIWASCGFHGAWNFTIGLLISTDIGGLNMDYALFKTDEVTEISYGIIGDPYYLVLIGMFAAAIAVLLFIGGNKLIVRVTQPADIATPPAPAEP